MPPEAAAATAHHARALLLAHTPDLPYNPGMSYRTFKRVLGETSLERKCRWWFGVSLAVLLIFSFTWYLRQTDKLVELNTRKLGQELIRTGFLETHFVHLAEEEKKLDRQSMSDTEQAPPTRPGWKELLEKYNQDFYRDFIESSRDLKMGRDFEWYAILPNGTRVDGAEVDEHEKQIVAEWLKRNMSQLQEADEGGYPAGIRPDRIDVAGEEYFYYHPLYAGAFCVECHKGVFDEQWPRLQEGDLMAVACAKIDHEPTVNARASIRAFAWVQAVVIGALSMLSLWAIVRYVIVKPLTHLRDVSNAVRQGDTNQRAQIRTGDEFEELAAAFNRMLRQLLSQQGELQRVNEELDTRLDELAQANMRLFEMNRLKSDFLATVSHELRTPLNSIIGFSEVMMTIDTLTEKQRRYAANIQRSGRVLLDMIDDILDLAKMESGRMDVKPSDFPIGPVLSAQCDMARPLTEKKNIDLELSVAPNLPPMTQDQAKVQQILNNLLSNAIKFTPEGGRINVSAERDAEGNLVLTVTDTGVGISEEDQALVFEKFRQGSSAIPGGDTMTREHTGTGLGLSIVRELCRLLGGEVSLRSELGRGSTFTVRLPWVVEAERRLNRQLHDELNALARVEPVVQAALPAGMPGR